MFYVTKELQICYAHRLLNYEGPCAQLHGHNARVEVSLAADALDERGMVYEFGELKAKLQAWMDAELDHRTLLREDDPLGHLLKEVGQPVTTFEGNPTAEVIASEIFKYAKEQGMPVTTVKVWETPTACAGYKES